MEFEMEMELIKSKKAKSNLALILLGCLLLSFVVVYSGFATAEGAGNASVVDRGMQWDAYNESGQIRIQLNEGPVNYLNDSNYEPINTTIVNVDPSEAAYSYGYRYKVDTGIYKTYFKEYSGDSYPVAFNVSSHVFRAKLLKVGYFDPSQNNDYVVLATVNNVSAVVDGNKITYPGVFGATDVEYIYENNKLKENIICKAACKTFLSDNPPSSVGLSDANSYLVWITKIDYQTLSIHNNGSTQVENFTTEDRIDFKTALDELKYFFPMNNATGANGTVVKIRSRLIHEGGNHFLLSGVKATQANNLAAPIIFDPTTAVEVSADAIQINITDASPVESITIYGFVNGSNNNIYIDPVSDNREYSELYAIDPTNLNFSNATVRVNAVGRDLFKCVSWNFSSQECPGEWIHIADLVPGQGYNFTLTAEDPGYGEGGNRLNIKRANNSRRNVTETILSINGNLMRIKLETHDSSKIKQIIIYDFNNDSSSNDFVIEDETNETSFVSSYSLDPTGLNFSNATISVDAVGNDLYKCVDWNFTTQTCYGNWLHIADLVVGQEYNFTIDAVDPGMGEENRNINAKDKDNYMLETNETLLANNSGILDIEVIFTNTSMSNLIKKMIIKGRNGSRNNLKVHNTRNNLSNPAKGKPWKEVFAIDPTELDFNESIIVIVEAKGKDLFKCTDFNFTTQNCYGRWKKIKSITIGEEYNFTLTQQDPAFAEADNTINILDQGNYLFEYNETSVSMTGDLADIEIVPDDITINKITIYGLNISSGVDLYIGNTTNETNSGWNISYSINAEFINFTSADITVNATGETLFKCTDWNATNQTCFGRWLKIQDLTPGQEYNLTIFPGDPGITEGSNELTLDMSDGSNYTMELLSTQGSTRDIVITFANKSLENLTILGYAKSGGNEISLSFNTSETGYDDTYSFNPNDVTFDSVDITSTSESGNILYKCVDWNYTTQTCYGSWVAYQSITPGKDYTITLGMVDPGLAEGSGTFFDDFESNNLSTNNWTTSGAGAAWKNDSSDPYAGTYFLHAETTGSESIVETNVSTEGYANVKFDFWWDIDGLDSGEYLVAEWYNGTGWNVVLNETGNPAGYSFSQNNLTSDATNNANLKIRFRCLNNNNGEECKVDNVGITGDEAISPVVSLVSPADGYTETDNANLTFIYNVTDTSSISNCSLNVIGSMSENPDYNLINTSITKNTDQNFTVNFEYNGYYEWNISCFDSANNQGVSETRNMTLSIAGLHAGSGEWTDSGLVCNPNPSANGTIFDCNVTYTCNNNDCARGTAGFYIQDDGVSILDQTCTTTDFLCNGVTVSGTCGNNVTEDDATCRAGYNADGCLVGQTIIVSYNFTACSGIEAIPSQNNLSSSFENDGGGTDAATFDEVYVQNITSSLIVTLVDVYGLNSSLGRVDSFDTINLEEIEYMELNFSLSSAVGNIDSWYLNFTANGTGACALGNRQSSVCYNASNSVNKWIQFINETTTATYDGLQGNQGDRITVTQEGSGADINLIYRIDEHYNPNIFKWYNAEYNFSDVKWQDGIDYRITGTDNMFKVLINLSLVPLDADQYKLDFRVNSSTGPVEPLEVYFCNSTYTTGHPHETSACSHVATKFPSDFQDDGTKFRAVFTQNLVDQLGDILYIILHAEESNTSKYYAMKTYNATAAGYTTNWEYTTDGGATWNNSGDGYETEMNINWFYNGTSPTEFNYQLDVNTTTGINSILEGNVTWNIDPTNNYPPVVHINSPNIFSIISIPLNITFAAVDSNNDNLNVSLYLYQGGVLNRTFVTDMNSSNSSFYWNDLTVLDGDYNLTLEACELGTADLFCVNDTNAITIDTISPVITIDLPANITYGSTSNIPLNYTVTDANGVSSCWYSLNGATNTTIVGCTNMTFNAAAAGNNILVYANDTAGNTNYSIRYFVALGNSTLDVFDSKDPVEVLEEFRLSANYTSGGSPITGGTCFIEGDFGIFDNGAAIYFDESFGSEPGNNEGIYGNNTRRYDSNETLLVGGLIYHPVVKYHKKGNPADNLYFYIRCDGNHTIDNNYLIGNVTAADSPSEPEWEFAIIDFDSITSENCSLFLSSPGSTDYNNSYHILKGNVTEEFAKTFYSNDNGQTWKNTSVNDVVALGHLWSNATMTYNSSNELYESDYLMHTNTIGNHTYNFTCESAGYIAQNASEIITAEDNAVPVVQITRVDPNPSEFLAENVTIEWIAIDFTINYKTINVTYPNGTLLANGTTSPLSLNTSYLSVVGNYTITAWANDSSGSIGNASSILTVSDTLGPTITLYSPTNQNYTNVTVLVNISASDSGSGIDTIWFFNRTENVTYTSEVYVDYNEGSNTLIAYANDSSGNLENLSIEFSVDTEVPKVIVVYPINHATAANEDMPIVLNITDVSSIYVLANVTSPNGTVYSTTGFTQVLQNDNFDTNSLDINWRQRNESVATGHTCYNDINNTVPGELFLSIEGTGSAGSTSCGLSSIRKLNGDFDMNITFNVTAFGEDTYLILRANNKKELTSAGTRAFAFIFKDGGQIAYLFGYANSSGLSTTGYATTNDVSGKLRIKRENISGTQLFSAYYWNNTGSSWITGFSSIALSESEQTQFVHLYVESVAASREPINVSVSDFSVSVENFTIGLFNQTSQEGLYNVSLFVNDSVGFVNNSESTNFTILSSNTPPSTPLVSTPGSGEYVKNEINITWLQVSDNEGDSLRFNITLLNTDDSLNATLATDYGNVNTTFYQWDTTAHQDGIYKLQVTVYENETSDRHASSSAASTVNIDNTFPTISIVSPLNQSYGNLTVLVNISANDANIDTTWFFNGTGNETYTGEVNRLFSSGSNTIIAYVNDSTGSLNSTSVTFFLDAGDPVITINSPLNQTYSNATVLVNISVIDGSLDKTWFFNGTENVTYTSEINVVFSEGSNTLIAYANDSSGNLGNSSVVFSIDTTAPNITNIAITPSLPLSNNGSSQNLSVNFSSSKYPINITFNLYNSIGSIINVSGPIPIASGAGLPINYTIPEGLSEGDYSLNMTAEDSANFGSNYTLGTFNVDTTPPLISSTTLTPYAVVLNESVFLNITASNGNVSTRAVITLPNSTNITVYPATYYNVTLPGRHYVTFYANDSAGNSDSEQDYFESSGVNQSVVFNVTNGNLTDVGVTVNVTLAGTDKEVRFNSFTGTKTEGYPGLIYDILFGGFNGTKILLRDVNITLDNNNLFGFDVLSTPVSGYLLTLGVNNTYTISNATVTLNYTDTGFGNEDYLGVYKCADWNFTNRTCTGTWADITVNVSQDKTANTVTFTENGFSAFSIKQEAVPVVTPPSGGGGGTSGGDGGIICDESWVCSDWESCVGDVSTRNCYDARACGTEDDKPIVGTSCEQAFSYCYDNVLNRDESDIDCGGKICGQCEDDLRCFVNADCISQSCVDGICGVQAVPAPSEEGFFKELFAVFFLIMLAGILFYFVGAKLITMNQESPFVDRITRYTRKEKYVILKDVDYTKKVLPESDVIVDGFIHKLSQTLGRTTTSVGKYTIKSLKKIGLAPVIISKIILNDILAFFGGLRLRARRKIAYAKLKEKVHEEVPEKIVERVYTPKHVLKQPVHLIIKPFMPKVGVREVVMFNIVERTKLSLLSDLFNKLTLWKERLFRKRLISLDSISEYRPLRSEGFTNYLLNRRHMHKFSIKVPEEGPLAGFVKVPKVSDIKSVIDLSKRKIVGKVEKDDLSSISSRPVEKASDKPKPLQVMQIIHKVEKALDKKFLHKKEFAGSIKKLYEKEIKINEKHTNLSKSIGVKPSKKINPSKLLSLVTSKLKKSDVKKKIEKTDSKTSPKKYLTKKQEGAVKQWMKDELREVYG